MLSRDLMDVCVISVRLMSFMEISLYVNDEIHENGLFIADGLIYFMMSDTGNWAKILMNPDDKRDWESKRASPRIMHYLIT